MFLYCIANDVLVEIFMFAHCKVNGGQVDLSKLIN